MNSGIPISRIQPKLTRPSAHRTGPPEGSVNSRDRDPCLEPVSYRFISDEMAILNSLVGAREQIVHSCIKPSGMDCSIGAHLN